MYEGKMYNVRRIYEGAKVKRALNHTLTKSYINRTSYMTKS